MSILKSLSNSDSRILQKPFTQDDLLGAAAAVLAETAVSGPQVSTR
jgi:hypothetical protein